MEALHIGYCQIYRIGRPSRQRGARSINFFSGHTQIGKLDAVESGGEGPERFITSSLDVGDDCQHRLTNSCVVVNGRPPQKRPLRGIVEGVPVSTLNSHISGQHLFHG